MIDASPTDDQRRHAYCAGAVARLVADLPRTDTSRAARTLRFYAAELTRIQWGTDLDGLGRRHCAMAEDSRWLATLEVELRESDASQWQVNGT